MGTVAELKTQALELARRLRAGYGYTRGDYGCRGEPAALG